MGMQDVSDGFFIGIGDIGKQNILIGREAKFDTSKLLGDATESRFLLSSVRVLDAT